jgi:hypothetical protein
MGFALVSSLLLYLDAPVAAAGTMVALLLFAGMECFFNVCMGCIVYNVFLSLRRNLS